MACCDLCHEYSTDPRDCTWCGHRIEERAPLPDEVARLDPPDDSFRPAPLTPFAEAIAPARAARRTEVSRAARWALEHGMSCDRDTVTLCLEVLDRFRESGSDERYHLRRVDVNHVLTCDAGNWSAFNNCTRSDDVAPALWVVLHQLAETGSLSSTSDPFATLLEPLQCYGGLGRDGRERPEGVDVDFPCQCYHAHDPTCPDGLARYIVGHHRETFEEFIVHAELALRSADPPMSVFEPLFRLTRRVRAAGGAFVPRVEEFSYVGRIPRTRLHDELWMYRLDPVSRRGFDPLVVDAHGRAVVATADRRRKLGYRWKACDDFGVMYCSGVAAREMATDRRPPRWDDEVGFGDLRAL